MVARFPEPSEFISQDQALKDMELVIGVVTGVRTIRGEMNIPPSKRVTILLEIPDREDAQVIRKNMHYIKDLAKVESVEVKSRVSKPEASATTVFGQNQVHVILKGLLNFKEETKRLQKEIKKIEKDMEGAHKKLSSNEFTQKAPPEIVENVKKKVESLALKLEKLNQNLNFFVSIRE